MFTKFKKALNDGLKKVDQLVDPALKQQQQQQQQQSSSTNNATESTTTNSSSNSTTSTTSTTSTSQQQQPVRVVAGNTTPVVVTETPLARNVSLQSLKERAGQVTAAAAQRVLPRRSSVPQPPSLISAYRDDRVMISAGGDLIIYYQNVWRRCNELTTSQATSRNRVDSRLRFALYRASQRTQALDAFSEASASTLSKCLSNLAAMTVEIDRILTQAQVIILCIKIFLFLFIY